MPFCRVPEGLIQEVNGRLSAVDLDDKQKAGAKIKEDLTRFCGLTKVSRSLIGWVSVRDNTGEKMDRYGVNRNCIVVQHEFLYKVILQTKTI